MARVVIPGFRKIETSGGEGGTTNYPDLNNKPSINNVPLVDNLSTEDLKLTDATLSKENVPAEARAVGIKFKTQTNTLSSITESLQNLETSMQGVYDQIGDHTVRADVPEDAKFTDTIPTIDTDLSSTSENAVQNNVVKKAIDDISVGGRNYVLGSSAELSTPGESVYLDLSSDFNADTIQGKKICFSIEFDLSNLKWLTGTVSYKRIGASFTVKYEDNTTQYVENFVDITNAKTMKGRISTSHTFKDKKVTSIGRFGMYFQASTVEGTGKILRPKVEFATKSSDWSPAIEDLEKTTDAQTAIDGVEAEIGDISTLQTQVKDSLVHSINYLNSQFTSLKGKVTELEGKIGE